MRPYILEKYSIAGVGVIPKRGKRSSVVPSIILSSSKRKFVMPYAMPSY